MKLFGRALLLFLFVQGFVQVIARPLALGADVPQSFTLDGRLFSNPQGTIALTDASVGVRLQVLDDDKTCVLYEESQSISTAASDGYFSVQVGSSQSSTKRTVTGDPGNTMTEVFSNMAPISGKAVADGLPCIVSPTGGKRRFVRIIISPSSLGGAERTLLPDLSIDSVPNALIAERAESIQGLRSSNLLQVNTSAGAVLTQGNLESLFSNTTRFTAVSNLVDGTSTAYMRSNSTTGAQLPVLPGAPSAPPTQGSIWFDSSDQKLKFQSSGGPVTLTTGAAAISALSGDVTASGNGTVAATVAFVGGSTAANVNAATVLANASTDANTVSTIVRRDGAGGFSAGQVSASAVRLRDATTNYVELKAPAAATNYSLTMPSAVGASGQTLVTVDAAGTLGWATPSSSQWTTTGSDIYYNTGKVGIGTATPSYLFDVNLGNTNSIRLQSGGGHASGFIGSPFSNLILGNNIYYNGSGYIQEIAGTGSFIQLQGGASAGDIRFRTSPASGTAGGTPAFAERMIITNGGNVGIGTVAPLTKLDVGDGTTANSIRVQGSTSASLDLQNTSGSPRFFTLVNSTGDLFLKNATNNSGAYYIRSSSNSDIFHLNFSAPANSLVIGTTGNVGIGTATPNASALLDVASTSKGVLLPRMTTAERDAIATPANGLQVYNTTTNALNFYNGSSWQALGVAGSGLTSLGGQTGGTQTFAAGSTGTAPAISSSGDVHTLNVPLASGAGVTSGTISKAQYDTFDAKLTSPLTTKGDLLSRDGSTHVRLPAGTDGHVLRANSATASGLEWAAGNAGTVTNVTSVNSYLSVATGSTTPAITANVGTAANTLAAGDDSRITGALQSTAYAADVADAAGCTAAQMPYWSSVGDRWMCAAISGLPASAISTGTIATARLGSGTADSTTYLRGDGAWTAPPTSQWTTTGSDIYYNSGNVGVGTASPTAPLYVKTTSSGLSGIFEGNCSGCGSRLNIFNAASTVGQSHSDIYFSVGSTANVYGQISGIATSASNGALAFYTNNGGSEGERMRIDNVGNVGIGTTTPGQKLSVNGRIETQGGMLFNEGSGATNNLIYVGSTSSGAVDASFGFFAAGVGSSSASEGSYFLTRGNSFSAAGSQRGNMYFVAGAPSAPGATEGSINFWTGTDQPRMIVNKDGNVGIGTTAPTEKLDINGTVTLSSSTESSSAYSNSGVSFLIADTSVNIVRVTLTDNATISLPLFAPSGRKVWTLTVFVKQDATGARTLTWNPSGGGDTILWDQSAVAPAPSLTPSKITIYQFTKPSDESNWYASMVWKQN